ncbi:MAG: hypothetical protein EXS08_06740 [Planctomycetes bacterium]|nr:hypothetical protein [Planctomycetota bacterium]
MAPTDPSPHRIPPNILVIVLDDVGVDKLSLFDAGQVAPPYARTPRMDALAESGMRFTSVHANPICSPTRACIQTGRYPFRTGMGGNAEVYLLPDSEVLLAKLLKEGLPPQQAYTCGAFGKWHLTPSDLSNEAYRTHAVRHGYNRFFGTLSNTSDHFNWTKVEYNQGWANANLVAISNHWSADVVRADAASWVNSRTFNRPYFAYVAFNPPHDKFQVPAFQTQDGRPLLSTDTRAELAGAQPGDEPMNPFQRELFYRAGIEAVDAEIGYLLDDIQQRLEHTMVFVVGDNGTPLRVITPPHDTNHGKTTFFQHGIRVPMIASGPLVRRPIPPGGHVCPALVDTVDIWSTIAAISGARLNPAPEVNGVSFLPLLKNPSASGARAWSFSQLFGPAGPYSSVVGVSNHGRSLTDGTYKYIRTVTDHVLGDPTIQYIHQLYRVADDPEEAYDFIVNGLTPEAATANEYLSEQMDVLSELT